MAAFEMEFTLRIAVHDERQFFEAALDSFCAGGFENIEDAFWFFLNDDGSPKWSACAIELFNPGCPLDQGFEMIDSDGEVLSPFSEPSVQAGQRRAQDAALAHMGFHERRDDCMDVQEAIEDYFEEGR